MNPDRHYQFHDTPITDRATGRMFLHRSYCETPAEAAAYARLTFTNPAVYAVGEAGESVIEAARAYSEGWKQPTEPGMPGWTLQNLDQHATNFQTETETEVTVQTELF